MSVSVFFTGLVLGLSLILPIGAQNAFVLRQGLRGEHVFAVCLTCALSDLVLIVAGVTSFTRMAGVLPWLGPVMRYGGAAFLAWYAGRSLIAALRGDAALPAGAAAAPVKLGKVLLACLTFTWLNPHVYLDTVVLLGSTAAQFHGQTLSFAAGAVSASFLFFFSLGYGATQLGPLFAKPAAWRVLDGAIAAVMATIAVKLAGAF